VTYRPLTRGRTANNQTASNLTANDRTASDQTASERSDPGLSRQAQSAGHQQGILQKNSSRQATLAAEATPPAAARTGGYLAIVSRRGARRVPTHSGMLRRRLMINASKFLLPATALLLLSSIALWPELHTDPDRARLTIGGVSVTMDGARLRDAHYNGMDDHGRPYTVTAATATQSDADRVDLTVPNGDVTLENGTWLNVRSKQGVYMRKDKQLDLSHDVVLYRDDGTTMTTDSATVALTDGAASGDQPTHVEGPFGTLDASGFTTVEKGAAIQFWGPVHVELNGVSR